MIAALAELGVDAEPAVWDADVDWARFDLVVLRSTWDYAERRDAFLAWARSLPRVLNPLAVLEWNTDKQRYLTRPGGGRRAGRPDRLRRAGRGARSRRTGRSSSSPRSRPAGAARRGSRPARTRRRARSSRGSTPTGGRRWFSPTWAMSRRPISSSSTARTRTRCTVACRFRPRATARSSTWTRSFAPPRRGEQERAVAEAALAAAPGELLYGRVDLVDGVVLELEVAEPSLYLAFGEGAAERFARAIVLCLGRGSL